MVGPEVILPQAEKAHCIDMHPLCNVMHNMRQWRIFISRFSECMRAFASHFQVDRHIL